MARYIIVCHIIGCQKSSYSAHFLPVLLGYCCEFSLDDVLSSILNHCAEAAFPLFKDRERTSPVIFASSAVTAASSSWEPWNAFPLRRCFRVPKRKKSLGAGSGEYDGCKSYCNLLAIPGARGVAARRSCCFCAGLGVWGTHRSMNFLSKSSSRSACRIVS